MLQIDHIYKFLFQNLFKDFEFWYVKTQVVKTDGINVDDFFIFNQDKPTIFKILFYDQEPIIPEITNQYVRIYDWQNYFSARQLIKKAVKFRMPVETLKRNVNDSRYTYQREVFATSEFSEEVSTLINSPCEKYFLSLYYFFHGFAALDWYRGFYALNYKKTVVKPYRKDYISFNRLVHTDRSYRIYFVSKLIEKNLVPKGSISFGVAGGSNPTWDEEVSAGKSKLSKHAKIHINQHLKNYHEQLNIDGDSVPGSASADIPDQVHDSFWHVVTETVFYYDKLHLTEKIFKPIVSKQPFMLLAAPGNLAYLKSYGFKTFDSVIDESYDDIQDPDQRIDAVVDQLNWYCNLTDAEKLDIAEKLEPIIEHNFHHFYGEFRHIITRELLDNCQTLFKELGYDDGDIAYDDIYRVLTA
jgi:hypothetical protein